MATSPDKLTLFKALRYIGFESSGTREISRGSVSVSLTIGYRSHWYVSTPFGQKDYQSQGSALHSLVLYRLINKEDLLKMAELGYEPAKKELESYEKTIARGLEIISSEDLRAEKKKELERHRQEFERWQKQEEQRKKLNAEVIELLKDKQFQKEKFLEREYKEMQIADLENKLSWHKASIEHSIATESSIAVKEETGLLKSDRKILNEILKLKKEISHHSKKSPICHICGKMICDYNGLISHIRSLHKEECDSLFKEARKRLNIPLYDDTN